MYIAALVFQFYNSILTNKIHCTYHEMQAANKRNKNERGSGVGLNLASLNCAFLTRAQEGTPYNGLGREIGHLGI